MKTSEQDPTHGPASLHHAAREAHRHGLCIIPAAANGTKQPWPDGPSWTPYKAQQPTTDQIDNWFTSGRYDGFGVVCGRISGSLEMLELEGRAITEGHLDALADIADASGLAHLWATITTGYRETTPSGGIHLLYRVAGPVAGNTKLARRPATPDELAAWKAAQQVKIDAELDPAKRARKQAGLDQITRGEQVPQVLIETRGEGGFVVTAPSHGRTHPTGKAWTLTAGGYNTIPIITPEERDALHHLAAALDQMPAPKDEPARALPQPRTTHDSGLRPGDDYNQRATWDDILGDQLGWTKVYYRGGTTYWRRAGKDDRGISATTGRNGADNLYVFSTSTIFEAEKPYDKFAAYTLITQGSTTPDACRAAARDLRTHGYGIPLPATPIPSPATGSSRDFVRDSDEVISAGDEVAASIVSDPENWPDEVPRDQADADQKHAYERDVALELHRLRVRDDATRRLRQERATNMPEPDLVMLDDFLAVEDEPIRYRIEGLWPVGGRILPAAQYKAGKTTLRDNLVRSLVDGEKFLDTFTVNPPRGRIVLIDNELDERMLRAWLRDQRIVNANQVVVLPLRGKIGTFDILDPDTRARWAAKIRAVDGSVVILDCLRPVFDALGLDENRDAGRFLVAFDTLLDEAGAEEAAVIHHMGHVGERSRGDSRLLDWPDVSWRLVRDKAEEGEVDPSAPRYFSAYGRDVNVPEGLLEFEQAGRRLRLVGGSRRDGKAAEILPVLYDFLRKFPKSSKNGIEKGIGPQGYAQKDIRIAIGLAVKNGVVTTVKGARGADIHTIAEGVTKSHFVSSSAPRQRGRSEFVSSSIDDELNSGAEAAKIADEVDSDKTPHSKDGGQIGTCQICGEEMVTLTPDQTKHPLC